MIIFKMKSASVSSRDEVDKLEGKNDCDHTLSSVTRWIIYSSPDYKRGHRSQVQGNAVEEVTQLRVLPPQPLHLPRLVKAPWETRIGQIPRTT